LSFGFINRRATSANKHCGCKIPRIGYAEGYLENEKYFALGGFVIEKSYALV